MNKSLIGAALVVAAALAVGFVVLTSSEDSAETASTNQTSEASTPSSTEADDTTLDTYTVSDVEMHSTEDDCWTYIDGTVYDITTYVPRHPGGDEILLACGADGSSLFNERMTDSGERVGSGTPHSSSATSQLDKLVIGSLKD